MVPNTLDETVSFTDGLATGPKLFGMGFTPRSERHREIIGKAFDEAQVQWVDLGLQGDE